MPSEPAKPAAQALVAPVVAPEAMLVVGKNSDGSDMRVPASKVAQSYLKASDLERRETELNQRAQNQQRLVGFASQIEARAKSDPEGALRELREYVERVSGKTLTAPDAGDGDMDPTARELANTRAQIKELQKVVGDLQGERVSAQVRSEVDRTLGSYDVFKSSPTAKALGELVTTAVRSMNPSAHIDDVSAHVNDLVMKIRAEALEDSRNASIEARGAGGVMAGIGMPGLSDQGEPMTVADVRSGRFRQSIQAMAAAAARSVQP